MIHDFEGYFSRTFQDQSDFPGPGIFKKKNQDFPRCVGTLVVGPATANAGKLD